MRRLSQPSRDVGVESAQRGGCDALGAAGSALRVLGHNVEIAHGDIGLDKLLQLQRGGDRAGSGDSDMLLMSAILLSIILRCNRSASMPAVGSGTSVDPGILYGTSALGRSF